MNEANPAIVNWREDDRNLLTLLVIIWKLSKQNIFRTITSFPLTPWRYKLYKDRTRNELKNTNTLKCYSSDEPAQKDFEAMNAKIIVFYRNVIEL